MSRYEQRKALKQSTVLIALSVAILLLFIFVLLPFSIRIYESILDKKGTQPFGDRIPPQIPILNPLPDATNSAQLVISGFGESDSAIGLFQNGGKVDEVKADTTGSFSFSDIPFQEGENVFYVVSSDESENSSESPKYIVVFDTTIPNLIVEQPTDGSTVNDRRGQLAAVKGTSEKGDRVLINGKLLFTDSTGAFSGNFQLQPGENILRFRAVDDAGNEKVQEIKVTYSP